MKVKTYKRTTKNYEDIYTKEKEVKEIQLDVNDVKIIITEHQLGMNLGVPHVEIMSSYGSHSMDFNTFMKLLK